MNPWRYFFFLFWFAYLIVASVLLFSRGFLLSRNAYTATSACDVWLNFSTCSNSNTTHCFGNDHPPLKNYIYKAATTCLPSRAKVVLIVIDALRYDFALFDPSLNNPMAFQNKLPIIYRLLEEHPTSTRLYKFIADPPTTTMQRLKGLTTGSLPTFIDAGSNFATTEINEDNIIDQLVKYNGQIVFMGDDTWTSLYPNRFVRKYPFPSFNVYDLDTVDTGVINVLHNELEKTDWNMLIGHFLGVDHCGHRYGPMHSEMTRKLTEMNEVIEKIVQHLDDNSILIVIGDHGMTTTGDHGGESVDEVTSAMFVHSKMKLISTEDSIINHTIKQVDLVPTLATLLGIPIPYSNLGLVVANSLPVSSTSSVPYPDWQVYLFALWSNVQQITAYIKDYAGSSEIFMQDQLQSFHERYASLHRVILHKFDSQSESEQFIEDAKEYVVALREMCEEVWIQFDSFSMSRGLLLMFVSIFFVYIIISGIPSEQLPEIFRSSFLPCLYFVLAVAAAISVVLFYVGLLQNLLSSIFFSTGVASVVMLSVLVIQNWDVIAIHWYTLSKKKTSTDLLLRLIFLLTWCGLLSNSYIVEEGYVSMFLLASVLVLVIYEPNKQQKKTGSTISNSKQKPNSMKMRLLFLVLLVCTLVRFSVTFWKCREEQQWCAAYFSHMQAAKPGGATGKTRYLMTLVTVAVFVTATRNWLRSCGNLVGFSPSVLLMRYAPTVMVVATGGFWVLHSLPKNAKNKFVITWQTDYLARVVYISVLLGCISIVFRPLFIYIIPDKKKVPPDVAKDNAIPELFNRVKGLFNAKGDSGNNSNVPIVCGLATVYSAAFVSLSVYICLLLILLLGDVISPSVVLLYFASALVLAVTGASKYEKAFNTAHLFEVSNSAIMAWMLLSLCFFYATGHQTTFPNIPWEAAFIGTGENFTNNFIPAALVVVNIFGSYILMGVTLPLLFIAPFAIHVLFPSFYSQKTEGKDVQIDLSRGEILLYENSHVSLNIVFSTSCKYILFHGLRVFVSMLAATIHCRHLMVWKIFAPKFIFEAIGMFVTLASVLLGYLLFMCINFKVDSLITQLNKKSR